MSKRILELDPIPDGETADAHKRCRATDLAYKELASQYQQIQNGGNVEHQKRFVPVSLREERSDMSRDTLISLMAGQQHNHWKGVAFGKCALDLVAYQQLMFEQSPCTIIELGCWCGGSALWFADQARICSGNKTRVVAVDITLENIADVALTHPGIEFHACDMNHIDSLFTSAFAASLPRPWLIVEDAHFGFEAVIRTFHGLMQPGDYLVAEDTSELLLEWYDEQDAGKWKPTDEACRQKRKLMKEYGTRHPELYRCDTKYLDMWGYNAMKCWNTIFKRVG